MSGSGNIPSGLKINDLEPSKPTFALPHEGERYKLKASRQMVEIVKVLDAGMQVSVRFNNGIETNVIWRELLDHAERQG